MTDIFVEGIHYSIPQLVASRIVSLEQHLLAAKQRADEAEKEAARQEHNRRIENQMWKQERDALRRDLAEVGRAASRLVQLSDKLTFWCMATHGHVPGGFKEWNEDGVKGMRTALDKPSVRAAMEVHDAKVKS